MKSFILIFLMILGTFSCSTFKKTCDKEQCGTEENCCLTPLERKMLEAKTLIDQKADEVKGAVVKKARDTKEFAKKKGKAITEAADKKATEIKEVADKKTTEIKEALVGKKNDQANVKK